MKYFSAILTLIFLNLAALTLVLYYGNKAKIIEEENKLISLDIKKNQEQLKINEVEFSLYHNYIYLKKLQKIYFKVENEIADQDVKFYLSRIRGVLDQIKYLSDTIIKLDKKPDKTRGLQKKIQKNVEKFKKLNQSTSLLLIAMQERISRVIGTSADGQKIDTYSEFFEKVNECSGVLHDATKKQQS